MIRFFRMIAALCALSVLVACGGGDSSPGGGKKMLVYNGPQVTQVVVNKKARKMYLLHNQDVLRSYKVALGNNPVGHKQFEGDGRTPEGIYFINRINAQSRYHLSVGISYPNHEDKIRAALAGMRPGGDIFIHGRGPEGRAAKLADWTAGCIAVNDDEIEEIFAMLAGRGPIPVVINP